MIYYTVFNQCAAPKLSKKVLHIGDSVAQREHCSEKWVLISIFDKKKIGLFYRFRKTGNLTRKFHQWIKHFGQFSEDCLYIAVKAVDEDMNGLSGKYYFHSLHVNVGVFIREPGTELFETK